MPAGTKQFPTQREHEAYCKASRIACELMPELPVFHTEIRETRSIFLPADSEFRCQAGTRLWPGASAVAGDVRRATAIGALPAAYPPAPAPGASAGGRLAQSPPRRYRH